MASTFQETSLRSKRQETAARFFGTPKRYLSGNHRLHLRAGIVAEMLDFLRGGEVIDIGCGDGTVSRPLAQTNSLTLLDSSQAMTEEARQNIGARVICGDLATHKPDQSYDAALLIGVLAHVDNTADALNSVARCLRSGGHALIQLSDAERTLTRLNLFLFWLAALIWDRPRYRPTRLDEVLRDAAAAGLQPVDIRRHLLLIPGLPRLLGSRLAAYDRFVTARPWLQRHCGDLFVLFVKH